MKIRILGGGWYGCHLAVALRGTHEVELHERSHTLFAGASGANPARLHLGFHYPRSRLTRAACQDHFAQFMARYGKWTHGVPINLYAIAAQDSLVDFGTFQQVLRGEVEFITVHNPGEYGLRNVEGALLTGERHILIEEARRGFEDMLKGVLTYGVPSDPPGRSLEDPRWDYTIDCTFCARDSENIQRYEPCVTGILSGPTDRAVTIMDGPFPSLYPWDEFRGLSSLTSAKFTPLARTPDRAAAEDILKTVSKETVDWHCGQMFEQLAEFWPQVRGEYRVEDALLSIRAMPRSGADARLVDVVRVSPKVLRVRAGKIDAILHAEQVIREMLR